MEQQTDSKLDKEYIKAVYCHPAYLTSMQSTSWEMLGWKKHKLKSRLPGEISITQTCRWHHPYGRKWRGTKKPLDESERGKWKSWLKAQHSENEDHGIRSHHFERLLLNEKRCRDSWPPGGEEFNLGPEMRLDRSELLCNKVLLNYKRDRESFWHNQKGAERVPPC